MRKDYIVIFTIVFLAFAAIFTTAITSLIIANRPTPPPLVAADNSLKDDPEGVREETVESPWETIPRANEDKETWSLENPSPHDQEMFLAMLGELKYWDPTKANKSYNQVLIDFQKEHRLNVTGQINEETLWILIQEVRIKKLIEAAQASGYNLPAFLQQELPRTKV